MSDETPDQVTLDDLPAIDWAGPPINDLLTFCPRCSGVVILARGAMRDHERWHAAIESLTVTVQLESTGPWPKDIRVRPSLKEQLIASGFAYSVKDVEQADAAASGRTEQPASEFTPLRSQLLAALDGLNPEMTTDEVVDLVISPVVEAWAEKYLHRATVAEAALQRSNDVVEELRNRQAAPSPRSAAEMHADLLDAMGIVEPIGFYDALDVVRAWRAELDVYRRAAANPDTGPRAGIIALLELAARGREAQAANASTTRKMQLNHQAKAFRDAADLVRDPSRIESICPDSMLSEWQTEDTDGVTDEHLSDLLLLVGVTPSAAQLSSWTPEQREQAANWAGLVHLSASDNNVDVPECPGFLVPDRFPGVVDVRSLNDTEDVWMCSRCGQRTGMMGHPNGCPPPAAEAEVCPSLYLHNGTLFACDGHNNQEPAHHANECLIVWSDAEAVPTPWPANTEPPAGIDLLTDSATNRRPYLHRVGRNAWQWSDTTKPPARTSTGLLWDAAVATADGDLRVLARPAEVKIGEIAQALVDKAAEVGMQATVYAPGGVVADTPAEAGPCSSLRLDGDGVLHACVATDDHHLHRGKVQPDGMMEVWTSNAGVPAPWPKTEEPPAGIDVLRDGEDGMYLCREPDGWVWWEDLADHNNNEADGEAHEWSAATGDYVCGELYVVRP